MSHQMEFVLSCLDHFLRGLCIRLVATPERFSPRTPPSVFLTGK